VKLHLSYYKEKTSVTILNELVEVKAFQIIVWVSVASRTVFDWDPTILRFPAILDIGNNHNFALSDEHLVKWARIKPDSLVELQRMREKGIRVPLRAARLWLHTGAAPFRLEVDDGIAVYGSDGPRLPTLGLRALTNSKLQTFIYGNTKQVVIRTPPKWYWPL
jgi:hypothetical protein